MLQKDDGADTRWMQLNELFHAAMGREEDEREPFLRRACAGNDELRRELESLLRYSGRELQLATDSAPTSPDANSQSRPASLEVGSILGSHRIVGRLGTGGMGEVYRALDLKLQREVAIKILPPDFAALPERAERFAHEAKVLASLNHPGIAAIYGLEESSGMQALILELVEGPTLADRIAAGPLPVKEALGISTQIIDAMEYAHDRGIIHRDLKPSNVKITPEGKVKVLDFGLAEGLSPDSSAPDDLTPGLLIGTPAYMSPEQARGKPVDRRTDVWSFGVLLYEMLTARRPFGGKSILDTLGQVIATDPDWSALPPRIPFGVRRLLELCLRKDPKLRLRNIGDAPIVMELGNLSYTAQSGRPGRRLIWAILVGAAITAAAITLVRAYRAAPEAPVVRLSVAPPDGLTLLSQAIAPNGRLLAFTARDGEGVVSLWVRPLDREKAERLPRTEGAAYPFWSPDSRFIGFFSGNDLRRIESDGGPTQTICAAESGRGGAWAADGTILFSKASDGVYAVSAAGGEVRRLTTLNEAAREGGHYWPHILPGGRRFSYTSLSASREARGVWIAELSRPAQRRRLIADQSRAIYASGHLLFVREGLLTAQRLNLSGLHLEGEPVPVVQGVTASLGISSGAAGFSASTTGVLVVGGGATGAEPSRLTWLDRSGRRLGTLGAVAPYLRLMLSPDRNRLVTDLPDANRALDLFVLDLDRLRSRRVTFDPGFDTGPVWSPQGDRIAFSSNRSGVYDLFAAQADGSGDNELLLHTERNKHPTDWSRDGRYILYVDYVSRANMDVWVLETSGERRTFPYLNAEYIESSARFSPDGRWVAYASAEAGREQIFVQSFPPGRGKWQISTEGGGRICWRPDGRELFFITLDDKLAVVEVSAGTSFAAGPPRLLFDTHLRAGGVAFDVSADGQRFLMPQPVERTTGDPVTVVLNWPSSLRPH